jgi:hypothetical protein
MEAALLNGNPQKAIKHRENREKTPKNSPQ